MSDLAVVTYLWQSDDQSPLYTPDDVRRLSRAVSRHLTVPYRFICVTDQPEVFDADRDIKAIPFDTAISKVTGHCIKRLMTFQPEGKEIFGADVVFQMGLNTLVVDMIDHIVSRKEAVVFWRNPALKRYNSQSSDLLYNGSFLLHRTGTMPWVWSNYLDVLDQNPASFVLWDEQTWLSYAFGPNAPCWNDRNDGIYHIKQMNLSGTGIRGFLPDNACLINCSDGLLKLHRSILAANPWLRKYHDELSTSAAS